MLNEFDKTRIIFLEFGNMYNTLSSTKSFGRERIKIDNYYSTNQG